MRLHARIPVAIITVIGFVLCSSQVFAAGFHIAEHSAQAMGMGNAVVAQIDTPAATFFNPAGLAQVKGFDMELGVTYVTPGAWYKGQVPGEDFEAQVDATRGHFFLPNLHAAYRFHDIVALGIGLYAPFGLTNEWPDEVTVGGETRSWWGRGIIRKISLETVYLTPSVGIQAHPRVLIGAGFSVVKGAVTMDRAVTSSADLADDIDVKLSGEDYGFCGTFGLLFKVVPDLLNFGFAFRQGASMSFEGKAAFTKDGSPDNIPAGLRTRLLDSNVQADLNIPHVIALGFSVFPMTGLSIGLGTDIVLWESYEKLEAIFFDERGNENTDLRLSEPKEWENSYTIRVGAEYAVSPQLDVRVGFLYDKTPVPTTTVGPELGDSTRVDFTLGAGYTMSGFRVDLAYMYVQALGVDTSEVTPLVGSYGANAHLLGLSLGYQRDL